MVLLCTLLSPASPDRAGAPFDSCPGPIERLNFAMPSYPRSRPPAKWASFRPHLKMAALLHAGAAPTLRRIPYTRNIHRKRTAQQNGRGIGEESACCCLVQREGTQGRQAPARPSERERPAELY